jgi:hypothetical protein
MDGIASLPVNGYYASSKFALEGITESLWHASELATNALHGAHPSAQVCA